MNLDQRSVTLNTELGLIIESPELLAQLSPHLERVSGYQVKLASDGKSIEWLEENGGGDDATAIVHRTELETTAWLRFKAWLLSQCMPQGQL